MVARRLHLGGVVKDAPKLSLPGKLVFPSMNHAGHFSMLGLGDIVSNDLSSFLKNCRHEEKILSSASAKREFESLLSNL